jgi:flagellar hook-associated protein 1
MNAITIGVAALAAGQRGLAVTGQNIANATTPGYRRQGISLGSRQTAGASTGVDVLRITRFDSPPLRAAILRGNSDEAALSARLDSRRQIEAALGQSPDDLGGSIESLFDKLDRLASRPSDTAARREFLAGAGQLASRFNAIANDIVQQRSDAGRRIEQLVENANGLTGRIAELNGRIYESEVRGDSANELRDQRDQLVDDLSRVVDFRVVEQPNGVVNLIGRDTALVVNNIASKLESTQTSQGRIEIRIASTVAPVRIGGGSVGGLLEEYNVRIPATLDRLDTLANSLVEKLDQAQATGLGASGPQSLLVGGRPVNDPAAPLATQGLAIPIQNGELTIGITNAATGTRTNSTIAIDPNAQSLYDVATAITAGGGGLLVASVDVPANVLRIQSQAGFVFDFAGRVPTSPPTNTLTGTSSPTLDGALDGTGSDAFTFNVIGGGTVGTTPGLKLEVRNAANDLVATLDVGEGYDPGSPLGLDNGLSVRFGAGTLTGGSFATPATGSPDTAGVLAGLGVGGLFAGTGAAGIRIRTNIESNPDLLATSRNGQSGDTTNLKRLAGIRHQTVGTGPFTLGRAATDISAEVGTQIRSLDDRQTAQSNIVQNLFAQEQAVTGVDVNEEVVKLLDFQRMIESAARYMSVVNESLDEIINLVR